MLRMRSLIVLLLGLFMSLNAQVGPYSWIDHLSLSSCNTLARFNGKIYASNRCGIVTVDENEGSTGRLNKINGLHDVNIILLRVNESTNKLMVIYENANIDVIDAEGKITNFPDIKIKAINGKKYINEVYFSGKFAYLATGLGIIVFDTEKMEVKDTYVIGPGGTNLEVLQVAMNDSLIFAATTTGLRYANYKLKILNNFSSWKLVPGIPTGFYSGVVNVINIMYAAYAPSKVTPGPPIDTLYQCANNVWTRYTSSPNFFRKTYSSGVYLGVFAQYGPLVIDVASQQSAAYITTCNGLEVDPLDMIMYKDGEGRLTYWIADNSHGLYKTYAPYPVGSQEIHSINGVRKRLISNIDIFKGEVAISPSYPNEGGGSDYLSEGINHFRNKEWSYFVSRDLSNNAILDLNCVYFDRKDNSRIWASSWSSGLCEFRDHVLVNTYGVGNSPLHPVFGNAVRAAGLSMDDDGNLWIANSDVKEYIAVRRSNGTFLTYNCEVPRFTRKIFADKNNFIWALHERESGLTVMKHDNFTNFQYKILTKDANNGNLGSNSIYSIAQDKDGKIWVGTAAGVRVFYNPANVFNSSGFDAEPIKIVQDGNVELLLEKETVTAIRVDGANNKWVGTQTGGIYCFNSDGQKELHHFTKENSPLYSNNIVDLNYDDKTGDIYIGTDLGIQSFRSTIIEGSENCSSMTAFPNPVKPSYTGNVFIRGLMDASIVKITDESGNLVWETKAQGGQVEWNKKNLMGAVAATGVYIAYDMSVNGEVRCITKILLVN